MTVEETTETADPDWKFEFDDEADYDDVESTMQVATLAPDKE